jgi:hypothetical protein
MAHLIGFAWNKAAFVGVDVIDFEATSIYPLNRNRVLEYFFSISDTNKTVTFTETAPPDMAPICAPSTSGTNSQNVLPISAGPSLNTLNTTLHSPVPKIFNFRKETLLFPLKKLIIPRKSKRIKNEIMSRSREKSKV